MACALSSYTIFTALKRCIHVIFLFKDCIFLIFKKKKKKKTVLKLCVAKSGPHNLKCGEGPNGFYTHISNYNPPSQKLREKRRRKKEEVTFSNVLLLVLSYILK
jgi:hypothetical protein